MVRGGEWADHSWADDQQLLARNHPTDASARAASFLQFTLPEDWSPDDLQLALLALPVPSLHARRTVGDTQPAGLRILSNRETVNGHDAPHLILVRRPASGTESAYPDATTGFVRSLSIPVSD